MIKKIYLLDDNIDVLRWSSFGRLSLLFIIPYHRTSGKARKDIKLAQKENADADNYIREYVRDYENMELPF